jgi:hypothetical protein
MTERYTVYGIRLRGDREVRYIGFTRGTLERRLYKHLSTGIERASYRPFLPWLRDHRDEVEAFPIASCDSEQEARRLERDMILASLGLGQRILNAAQVPWSHRQACPTYNSTPAQTPAGLVGDAAAACCPDSTVASLSVAPFVMGVM